MEIKQEDEATGGAQSKSEGARAGPVKPKAASGPGGGRRDCTGGEAPERARGQKRGLPGGF